MCILIYHTLTQKSWNAPSFTIDNRFFLHLIPDYLFYCEKILDRSISGPDFSKLHARDV